MKFRYSTRNGNKDNTSSVQFCDLLTCEGVFELGFYCHASTWWMVFEKTKVNGLLAVGIESASVKWSRRSRRTKLVRKQLLSPSIMM